MVKGNEEGLLTANEVAVLLRTTRATIYDYIKRGKLKGIKIGRRRLFTKEEVIDFLGYNPFKEEPEEILDTPELQQAKEDLMRADDMRRQRKGEEVVSLAKQLQKIFNKAGDFQGHAYAQFVEGGGLLNSGNFPRAARVLGYALALARKVEDRTLEGMILGTAGTVADRRGRYEEALSHYLQAVNVLQRIRAKDKLAIAYQNLGVLFKRINRPLEALFYYKRAFETARATKMPPYFEPELILSLGDTYLVIGDNPLAFSHANRAYNIGVKRNNPDIICRSTNGMGRALWQMRDFAGARESFAISYEYWQQLEKPRQDANLSMAINSLIALEKYKACLKLLQRKENLLAKRQRAPSELAGTFSNYARCYLGLNEPQSAIDYSGKALDIQVELGQLAALWRILRIRAESFAAQGDHGSACDDYGEVLFHLNAEIDRSYAEGMPATYEYQLNEIREEYAHEIFSHADNRIAWNLSLKLIAESAGRVIAEKMIYPDPVKGRHIARKYTRNRTAIVNYFRTLSRVIPGTMKPTRVKQQKDRLARLRARKDELASELSTGNPLYLPLQGEGGPSIDEIKELYAKGCIPADSSILVIHLAENNGQGFLVDGNGVVERRNLEIGYIKARHHLGVFINSCRSIGGLIEAGSVPALNEQQNVKETLAILYNRLFKPFEDAIDKGKPLVLLTHGPLNFLPFGALYNGREYLCEYLRIIRLLSPAFLRAMSPPSLRASAGQKKLLVVSPFLKDEHHEAIHFIKSLKTKQLAIRTGEKAVVENVRPDIAKYYALLYVGDYYWTADNPDRANLKMYQGPGLTAYELFTQRYDLGNVNSIVLYTGGLSDEEIGSTEPFLPIQRAFLTAGARNVTTFLWKLDPSSLSKVLGEIYTGFISDGTIGPETIQSAQTRLLMQPMTSHPYFWAGIHSFALTE